jgi:hypothetical protein
MAVRGGHAPAGDESNDYVVDEELLRVVVRPAPRYGRFIAVGIGAGIVIAVVLTVIAGVVGGEGGPIGAGLSGVLRVFGIYAAVFVGLGLLISATLAMVLEHRARKRAISARAWHDTTLVVHPDRPVNDDIPQWARDADDLR